MEYFESHAHYDDERFDADRDYLLGEGLPAAGVKYVVNVSADMDGVRESAALAAKYGYIYATVGAHPHYASDMTDEDMASLYEAAKGPRVVAIGEIGLDYHYDGHDKAKQARWFNEQLALARHAGLPVVIHSRDAHKQTFDILKGDGAGARNGGVIHCYSGSAELAEEYVKLGFHIGVGGVATFKNAKALIETARRTPLERLLIETDCPYLAPEPHRGERNDSRYLSFICAKVAEVRGEAAEVIAAATMENARRLFGVA